MHQDTSCAQDEQPETFRLGSGSAILEAPESIAEPLSGCTGIRPPEAVGEAPIDLIIRHKSGQESQTQSTQALTESFSFEEREQRHLAELDEKLTQLNTNLVKWCDDRYTETRDNHLVAEVLESRQAPDDAERLQSCGSYRILRAWLQTGNLRLREANFCKLRACRACSRMKAALTGDTYTAKTMELLRQSYETGRRSFVPTMITVTVPPDQDLARQLLHLTDSLRSVNQLRKNSKKKGRKHSEWGMIAHLAMSVEIKRSSSNPECWHCHAHGVGLTGQRLNLDLIHEEWKGISGASHRPDVRLLTSGRLLVNNPPAFHRDSFQHVLRKDLKEVFKYSTKFTEMSPEDIAESFFASRRRRLLMGWNGFHGCKVPDDLSDLTDEPGPWFDYHFGRDASRRPLLIRMRQGDDSSVGPWDVMERNQDVREND